MAVTINLDYQTLQALFGGNDQAAIDIRQSVVNTFAKRYLKTCAAEMGDIYKSQLITMAIQEAISQAGAELAKYIDITNNSESLKEIQAFNIGTKSIDSFSKLSAKIIEYVETIVDKVIKERLESDKLRMHIDAIINDRIKKIVNDRVAEQLNNIGIK